jgi:CheY-like chemotaxis protein
MKKSTTVFLVEDDEDDRYSFVLALDTMNDVFLLDIASNGKEALEKLRRAPVLPEMIFVDYSMPVMNGLDFLAAMSEDSHIKHIPTVMLSSSEEMREKAFTLGAKGFIRKTSNDTVMRNEMTQVLKSLLFIEN